MSKAATNKKLDKFMGMPLGGEDASDSDGSEESTSGSEDHEDEQRKQPRKKLALSVEDLEKAGYKSGPSVLFVKPPAEQEPQNWNWSNGRAAKEQEDDEDDHQDRAATRDAVGRGLEESAALAVRSMEHAARLREAARQERLEAQQERAARDRKPQSFNQKEKRKRDTGQTSRGKNYVEESKRQARAFGVYSGFD